MELLRSECSPWVCGILWTHFWSVFLGSAYMLLVTKDLGTWHQISWLHLSHYGPHSIPGFQAKWWVCRKVWGWAVWLCRLAMCHSIPFFPWHLVVAALGSFDYIVFGRKMISNYSAPHFYWQSSSLGLAVAELSRGRGDSIMFLIHTEFQEI